MKISVILTSFNRPHWIMDSLKSIEQQTYQNFQLIVIDESDLFDIEKTLKQFMFPELVVKRFQVTPDVRRLENRLSVNCNLGLSLATGDLVCFLADDDYFYPDWFAAAANYFRTHPLSQAAFGKLVYSSDPKMTFPGLDDQSQVRFYKEPVKDPYNRLDHNQVIHRHFDPPFRWPVGAHTVGGPDAHYFRSISEKHLFHPIDQPACVKRIHPKGLMQSQSIYINGFMEGLRE